MVAQIISERFKRDSVTFTASSSIQEEYIEIVKAKINNGNFRLVHSKCICGSQESLLISEVERYGLNLDSVLCTHCGTVRFDPYLDESSINEFYTEYYQFMYNRSMDEESYFSRQRMYGEKFLSIVQTSLSDCKVVFELGCGSGGALAVFMENGYQVAGCDYDRRLLEFGSAKGVTNLHYGSLKELQIALPDVKADFIFMNHVFEHASNPETLLVECKKALTSNGRIVISVPDILNVDKFDFFKGDVLPMLHIAHKYNYSFQGLHELAKRLGLWAQLIYPSDSIKTHTSIMPELWVEMKESNGTENENMEFVTNTLDRILFLEQVYQSNLIISRQPSPRSVESSLFERLAKILGFK